MQILRQAPFLCLQYDFAIVPVENFSFFRHLGYNKLDPAGNGSVKSAENVPFLSGYVDFGKMGLQTPLFPLHPKLF